MIKFIRRFGRIIPIKTSRVDDLIIGATKKRMSTEALHLKSITKGNKIGDLGLAIKWVRHDKQIKKLFSLRKKIEKSNKIKIATASTAVASGFVAGAMKE